LLAFGPLVNLSITALKIKKWRHFPAGSLRRINLRFGIIGESGRYSDVTGCRGEGPTKTPPGILSRAAFYIKEL
jgi:hypothetical protein